MLAHTVRLAIVHTRLVEDDLAAAGLKIERHMNPAIERFQNGRLLGGRHKQQ